MEPRPWQRLLANPYVGFCGSAVLGVVALLELVRVTPWPDRRRLVQQVVAVAVVAILAVRAAVEIAAAPMIDLLRSGHPRGNGDRSREPFT